MDRSTKQKINKETQTLNDTIDQLDLIGIYRTFHPKTMNFTFFSSAHGTFSRTDHILGHKSSLGKFKKNEIIPSIFSDHSAIRLDVYYRKKTIKNANIWRLNNTLRHNQQITEEMKKRNKNMHQIRSVAHMSDSLRSHESQHTRPPCPLPTPGVYSNSCPLSQ